MVAADVVNLNDRKAEPAVGSQLVTCANPGCFEQFTRSQNPGRPREFHDENCRQAAKAAARHIRALQAHHESEAQKMRDRLVGYSRDSTEDDEPNGPSAEQQRAAEDAVLRAHTVVRFMGNRDEVDAQELTDLVRAITPLIRPDLKPL